MAETPASLFETVEGKRLARADADGWRRWGPYLSDRQWGTVREDYSADGEAWSYLPHDHARSRAYRWGEDGIAGFCDDRQIWCLSLGLWNGADPILKERMFGLTNDEGNHGEDVKELWWHLDGTPTHSYQRMLYRYPQRAFPYDDLIRENARRKAEAPEMAEYKLADTGVLAGNRFFDVSVEYAKNGPDDILLRVGVRNRGQEAAALHVLPQLLARNTWSWGEPEERPELRLGRDNSVAATCRRLPPMRFSALQQAEVLFCENETNVRRLFGVEAAGPFKDAINDALLGGAPMPHAQAGTKCAAISQHEIAPGDTVVLRYRFSGDDAEELGSDAFDGIVASRRGEADAFFDAIQKGVESADARLVQRRAFAGLLWSKQFYLYDVRRWLDGDPGQPAPPPERLHGRNSDWTHLDNREIVSMPDKWEYPWYASWDLALQAVALAAVDPAFAKGQLLFLTRDWSMHPSGQFPAFEWDFGKANPPVQAFAALKVFRTDAALTGKPDHAFLQRMLQRLTINFTWWVNRKDAGGHNLFQGGFLGLDNISIFDRSEPVPGGGTMEQADGTAWMAMYALNLMRMALILGEEDRVQEDLATKFFEHFLLIASAMTHPGTSEAEKGNAKEGLWDEADGFFYDALVLPDGTQRPLRLRSLVGLIPLCAVEVLEPGLGERHPAFAARLDWLLQHRPDLTGQVSRYDVPGNENRLLLSLLRRHRTGALLSRMLDGNAFLSPFGVRSLSREYGETPFRIDCAGTTAEVRYEPGTSRLQLFGGNSNWRGPVWMPVNYLLVEALREFDRFYGDRFSAECPAGSGRRTTLGGVADEIARRLCSLFLAGPDGRRPALNDVGTPPADEPLIAFHEFFHGETGQGLGAAHQTGWTSLVALLLSPRGAGSS